MAGKIRLRTRLFWYLCAPLIGLLLLLVLVVVAIVVTVHLLWGIALLVAVWWQWRRRGKYVLLVTSDSPNWHDHFQQDVISPLAAYAVLLNWSQRKQWRRSLATRVFRHFGGGEEFNPLAVVFGHWGSCRCFRFHQPYLDRKHGKPEAVEQLREELLTLVAKITGDGGILAPRPTDSASTGSGLG